MPNSLPVARPEDIEVPDQGAAGLPVADKADIETPHGGGGVKAFMDESILNVPKDLETAATVAKNPLGAAKAVMVTAPGELLQKGIDAYKRGDYLTAVRHGLLSLLPGLGPSIDKASDEAQQGDYASAAGRSLGIASNFAVPEAVKAVGKSGVVARAADSASEGMTRSVYKPRGAQYDKIDNGIDAIRQHGITPDATGDAKLADAVNTVGNRIGLIIDNAPAGSKVDIGPILQAANDAQTNALASQRAGIQSAISDFEDAIKNPDGSLPQQISIQDAHALKVKLQDAVVQSKKSFYSGEGGAPGTETRASMAGDIGKQISDQYPEIKGPNAEYGGLMDARALQDAATNRIANRSHVSLLDSIAGLAGFGAHGIPGGITGAILSKIVTDPRVLQRVANGLSNMSGGTLSPMTAAARLTAIAKTVGAPATAAPALSPQFGSLGVASNADLYGRP